MTLDPSDHDLLLRIDERLKALEDHIDDEFAHRDQALEQLASTTLRTRTLIAATFAAVAGLAGVAVAVVALITR